MSGGEMCACERLDPPDLPKRRGGGETHARQLPNCIDERRPVALTTHTASTAQREEETLVRSAI